MKESVRQKFVSLAVYMAYIRPPQFAAFTYPSLLPLRTETNIDVINKNTTECKRPEDILVISQALKSNLVSQSKPLLHPPAGLSRQQAWRHPFQIVIH